MRKYMYTHVHVYICETSLRMKRRKDRAGNLLPRIEDTGLKVD